MKTSERLRELDTQLSNTTTQYPTTELLEISKRLAVLRKALPLIADVVEAAEREADLTRRWFSDWTEHHKDDWRIRLQEITPALDATNAALTALRDALEKK